MLGWNMPFRVIDRARILSAKAESMSIPLITMFSELFAVLECRRRIGKAVVGLRPLLVDSRNRY